MLTAEQIDTIKQWESCDDWGKKEHIKTNLTKSLYHLQFLRDLPTDDSREIVQDAIERFDENDYSQNYSDVPVNVPVPEGDSREWGPDAVNRTAFASKIFAVLFNGLTEDVFNAGVNRGPTDAVRWRAAEGDLLARTLYDRLERTAGGPTDFGGSFWQLHSELEIEDQDSTEQSTTSDDQVREWVRRVYLLETDTVPERDTVELICGGLGWEIPTTEIELPDKPTTPDEPSEEDELVLHEYLQKWEDVNTILSSQKRAKKVTFTARYPRNDSDEFDEREIWEYIHLHQRYLKEEGHMPSEDQIPDQSASSSDIRNPAVLNLADWTFEEPLQSESGPDVVDIDN